MNRSQGQNSQGFFRSVNFATHPSCLPVSRGDDIVHGRWWRVCGGAEWLTQTVGARLAEHEPVSDVELRQQAVLHYLVQVVPRGTPQAAAEHRSIQGRVLLTHTHTVDHF